MIWCGSKKQWCIVAGEMMVRWQRWVSELGTWCRRGPPHHFAGGVGPASVWGQGSAPISRQTRCGKSWRVSAFTRGGACSPSRAPWPNVKMTVTFRTPIATVYASLSPLAVESLCRVSSKHLATWETRHLWARGWLLHRVREWDNARHTTFLRQASN